MFKMIKIIIKSCEDWTGWSDIKELVDWSFHNWVKNSRVDSFQGISNDLFNAVLSNAVNESNSSNHQSNFAKLFPVLSSLIFFRRVGPITNKIVILNYKGVAWTNHEENDQELNPMAIEVSHYILIILPGNFNDFVILILNDSTIIFILLGSKLLEQIFLFTNCKIWWEDSIFLFLAIFFLLFNDWLLRFSFVVVRWFSCCFFLFFTRLVIFVIFILAVFLVEVIDLLKLLEYFVLLHFLVGSLSCDFSLIHHNDFISHVEEINSMCYQNSCLTLEHTVDNILHDVHSDVSVKCRDWVIQQIDIFLLIDGSGKSKSGLLSTTQVDSFLSNFSKITTLHDFKVSLKLTILDCVYVFVMVQLSIVENVISKCLILNPWFLLS